MKHLQPGQIEELRQELQRQLRTLERSGEATSRAVAPVELDQAAVGRLSRMDSLQNQSLSKNLQERENTQVALVQAALQRMETGAYGVCVSCGGEIPFQRLFVFPEAELCPSCAGAS